MQAETGATELSESIWTTPATQAELDFYNQRNNYPDFSELEYIKPNLVDIKGYLPNIEAKVAAIMAKFKDFDGWIDAKAFLHSERGQFTSGTTDYVVEGSVNGIRADASPDTGSDECIISSDFAFKLGRKPAPGTQKMITLANNKSVRSPGMIEVLWKFANDQTPHNLKCWILPGSSKDFVLGSRFLRATETITTFRHRVKKVLLPSKLRLRLMGEEKQRMVGFFNDQITTALADTGSDLMLISSDYAQRRGLAMDTGRHDRTEVELADGTRIWTCGTVRNATWTVENSTVRCDFQVLEGLPADVLLSKDYLFDLDVFSKHPELFFDIDSVEGMSLLCGIRLVEEGQHSLDELEREFLRDGKKFADLFAWT